MIFIGKVTNGVPMLVSLDAGIYRVRAGVRADAAAGTVSAQPVYLFNAKLENVERGVSVVMYQNGIGNEINNLNLPLSGAVSITMQVQNGAGLTDGGWISFERIEAL